MTHQLHKCDDENCFVCLGGLSDCEVCGGAEGCLPKDCPGRRMTIGEMELVMSGTVNYINGQWVDKQGDKVDTGIQAERLYK